MMYNPLRGVLRKKVSSKPVRSILYGYRWQPAKGMPGVLQPYDPEQEPAGIYVLFTGHHLSPMRDDFGRLLGGPGTVFPQPTSVPNAVLELVATVARDPPAGEDGWKHPPPGRFEDIGGFLEYVATCLDLLYRTSTGKMLLSRITASGHPIFIMPGDDRNRAYLRDKKGARDTLTRAVTKYESGGPIPVEAITVALARRWPQKGFDRLADEMNRVPLYSLFEPETAFQPAYLGQHFRWRGAPLTAAHLQDWCTPKSPAGSRFDAHVRSETTRNADGVPLLDMFLLALCTTLGYSYAPAGSGSATTISFSVQNIGGNLIGSPDFRPPAIGLGHELVRAMHAAAGTLPGLLAADFSATALGLLIAGIGSYATDSVNENAIRRDWATLQGPIDNSNVWAHPVQRLVYEPPSGGKTVAQMRDELGCL